MIASGFYMDNLDDWFLELPKEAFFCISEGCTREATHKLLWINRYNKIGRAHYCTKHSIHLHVLKDNFRLIKLYE